MASNRGTKPAYRPLHPAVRVTARSTSEMGTAVGAVCSRVLTTSSGLVKMVDTPPAKAPLATKTPLLGSASAASPANPATEVAVPPPGPPARSEKAALACSWVSHHTAEFGPKNASVAPVPRHSPIAPSRLKMSIATCTPVRSRAPPPSRPCSCSRWDTTSAGTETSTERASAMAPEARKTEEGEQAPMLVPSSARLHSVYPT
eukprot:scaffold3382_cov108-Isochrysis_galbana.AAC.7